MHLIRWKRVGQEEMERLKTIKQRRHRNRKTTLQNLRSITTVADNELPQEVIQLIQSMIQSSNHFQCGREAARTSLVSKSWYRAWCTRPDLVFNLHCFPSSRAGADLFEEFAKTTLKWYKDLNLNIRSLRLVMSADDVPLVTEWIVKALTLGVGDLTFQILEEAKCLFVLPEEVLQSQTLARLNLRGPWGRSLTINQEKKKKKKEEVTCSNLKSLKLEFVKLNDNFWARFACLKELEIANYHHLHLKICIPSLEHINITLSSLRRKVKIVELDFPNIRKFNLRGALPLHFELKTRRHEWESDIDIFYMKDEPIGEWFGRLSQFVRMLNLSQPRVSLSILPDESNWGKFTNKPQYFGDGLAIPAVENLTLKGNQTVTPAFLDALFWSCRPKFVKIEKKCLFRLEKVNVQEFQQLRSLPWETFYHVSCDEYGYDVCFQLT